jgi:hypothetical protein
VCFARCGRNRADCVAQGANVGEIIGLFINGWVSERFGYRYTVMTCLVMIIGFTAIFFTAQSVIALQVAEILCGIVSYLLFCMLGLAETNVLCSRGECSKHVSPVYLTEGADKAFLLPI